MRGFESSAASHAPRLPILIDDQRALAHRGAYWFDRRWLQGHESIVSLLWKFVRVNGVSGLELMHHLAPHLTDPYEGISPFDTKLQRRALRSLLRIGPRRLRTSVESQGRTAEQFQFCPKCLFSGLHGVVHQRRGLQQCPAHAIPMRSRCKHCERPIAYRLTTTLLDAPFACPFCRRRLVARIWLPGHSRRLAMTHRTSLMRAWVTGL